MKTIFRAAFLYRVRGGTMRSPKTRDLFCWRSVVIVAGVCNGFPLQKGVMGDVGRLARVLRSTVELLAAGSVRTWSARGVVALSVGSAVSSWGMSLRCCDSREGAENGDKDW